MHSKKYMHRDIKPENILINTQSMEIKLADFGLAKNYSTSNYTFTEYVSTRWYRAPELTLRSNKYN